MAEDVQTIVQKFAILQQAARAAHAYEEQFDRALEKAAAVQGQMEDARDQFDKAYEDLRKVFPAIDGGYAALYNHETVAVVDGQVTVVEE